ncbi:hypothetical protein KW795_01305, partial [Candidatus Microgenomates bacterium]|nr:hypothetical protein [Candidatus Microgenomates bacterium]
WTLDQTEMIKLMGGDHEVAAFSHGLVILAFLYHLEKKLNTKILNDNWDTMFAIKKDDQEKRGYAQINYLSSMNTFYTTENPEELRINFAGQNIITSTEVVKEMIEDLKVGLIY